MKTPRHKSKSIFGLGLQPAKSDIKLRNEGSYKGILWYLIVPLLMFGHIHKLPVMLRRIIHCMLNEYSNHIPDKYYLVNYAGGKIYLNLNVNPMMRGRLLGLFQKKQMNLFKRLVKPNMTIIDVGVCTGYFSLLSAKLMKDTGEIYSIEPDPINYSWTNKSIKANNYKNIRLFQLAFSNENCTAKLFKAAEAGGHSLKGRVRDSITVKVKKLDDFLKENDIEKVDIIKIDVEGAEIDVLEGAKELLQQNDLKIIMDVHTKRLKHTGRKKLFNILSKNNFIVCKYNFKKIIKINENEFLNMDIKQICAKKMI